MRPRVYIQGTWERKNTSTLDLAEFRGRLAGYNGEDVSDKTDVVTANFRVSHKTSEKKDKHTFKVARGTFTATVLVPKPRYWVLRQGPKKVEAVKAKRALVRLEEFLQDETCRAPKLKLKGR